MAALLMILGLIVVVFLPASILVALLIGQASDLVDIIQRTDLRAMFDSLGLERRMATIVPKELMGRLDLGNGVLEVVRSLPGMVAARGGQLLAGIVNAVVDFLFMLFGMFYFYTEGEGLIANLRSLSPLATQYNDDVIHKFKQVIDGTFRGHFLTALAQGVATGIGLAITGVQGALFWGAVATIFALVPLFGAAIVWVPATAYLILLAILGKGSWVAAIVLGLWGVVIVSLVDNVIRPWAMKGSGETSAVVLLISVLGGINAFGFLGIILGPLVFALLVTVIDLYKALLLGAKPKDPAAPAGFV